MPEIDSRFALFLDFGNGTSHNWSLYEKCENFHLIVHRYRLRILHTSYSYGQNFSGVNRSVAFVLAIFHSISSRVIYFYEHRRVHSESSVERY